VVLVTAVIATNTVDVRRPHGRSGQRCWQTVDCKSDKSAKIHCDTIN
jgi:hypothetical protein